MSKRNGGGSSTDREVRTDSKTSAVAFVRPLAEEIQKEVTTPEVDLSSPERAAESLIAIGATLEKLNAFRSRVSQLKPLLEQEKYELEK